MTGTAAVFGAPPGQWAVSSPDRPRAVFAGAGAGVGALPTVTFTIPASNAADRMRPGGTAWRRRALTFLFGRHNPGLTPPDAASGPKTRYA
ncbi:hypothetical protein GCM10022630_13040 [Thermobifida alba]